MARPGRQTLDNGQPTENFSPNSSQFREVRSAKRWAPVENKLFNISSKSCILCITAIALTSNNGLNALTSDAVLFGDLCHRGSLLPFRQNKGVTCSFSKAIVGLGLTFGRRQIRPRQRGGLGKRVRAPRMYFRAAVSGDDYPYTFVRYPIFLTELGDRCTRAALGDDGRVPRREGRLAFKLTGIAAFSKRGDGISLLTKPVASVNLVADGVSVVLEASWPWLPQVRSYAELLDQPLNGLIDRIRPRYCSHKATPMEVLFGRGVFLVSVQGKG